MNEFDAIDMALLELLVEDARRPYSDMAEHVELSAPAVRDRVTRLQEAGIIRRFTVDVDRSLLNGGIAVLVTIEATPGAVDEIRQELIAAAAVEHVYLTADTTVIAHLVVEDGKVREALAETIDMTAVRSLNVELLEHAEWTPGLQGTTLALECAECGNTVTAEGESTRLEGTVYHFCCPSCADRFVERHEEFSQAA